MGHVAGGGYEMVGTFNGNPLAMVAARAMLTQVATPAAYDRLARLRERAEAGLTQVITAHQLNGRVVTAGAKGCVVFLGRARHRLPRVPHRR
jgi:glutamate-1-semialdehyde 2,1-aminomutase